MEKTSRDSPRDKFIHKILDIALFSLGLNKFTLVITNNRVIVKPDWQLVFINEQLKILTSLHIEVGISFEEKHFFFMIPEDLR